MSTFFQLRSFTSGIFGYSQTDRCGVVLKAFFDDSGTHDGSDVIVMAGLIAHEDAWATFEPKWAAALKDFGIDKMRMSACEGARKPFCALDRFQRDRIIAVFSDIVISSDACMLGSSVSAEVWKSVAAKTSLSSTFAHPLDFLYNVCMRQALETHSKRRGISEPVAVFFDSREENLPFWSKLGNGYQSRWNGKVAGYSFVKMIDVLPLQAADMIAYELFHFQCAREREGKEPSARPNFKKLQDALQFKGGYFTQEHLEEYARGIAF